MQNANSKKSKTVGKKSNLLTIDTKNINDNALKLIHIGDANFYNASELQMRYPYYFYSCKRTVRLIISKKKLLLNIMYMQITVPQEVGNFRKIRKNLHIKQVSC